MTDCHTALLQCLFEDYSQPESTGDYLIQLRPKPGIDGTHALRGALKTLLRYHGLRVVKVEQFTSFHTST